ncbi:hypothetical protein L6164_024876 [Bauhinia variegata]|uniref:Uncharacterized protein n=1 Tax=Bauhinia variegata TaxID=167791 RepID=A0ACB9M0I6_BAUVA|nr:hypothetical protein L6164_024876 [Bauhinia variegata]
MDAVLTRYWAEQSIAPYNYKQISTKTRNNAGGFISKTSENFNNYGGLLHAPPHSVLPFSYPISSAFVHVNNQQYPQSQQQPPLLPLPVSAAQQPLVSRSLNRGISCPPANRKNRTRQPSLTPKKSKRERVKRDLKPEISNALDNRMGPDPNHLPLVLSRSASSLMGKDLASLAVENIETFSGSIFNLAPPPSSLPLPKFSLRPKLGCNAQAQAAGIDTGATDNLRRILRLR